MHIPNRGSEAEGLPKMDSGGCYRTEVGPWWTWPSEYVLSVDGHHDGSSC